LTAISFSKGLRGASYCSVLVVGITVAYATNLGASTMLAAAAAAAGGPTALVVVVAILAVSIGVAA
jgi:hypothetical protein